MSATLVAGSEFNNICKYFTSVDAWPYLNVLVNLKNRIFIPIHMITYIQTELQQMGAMPIPVATGIVGPDGKTIIEYRTPEGETVKPS